MFHEEMQHRVIIIIGTLLRPPKSTHKNMLKD
jgi:hypothetical protein